MINRTSYTYLRFFALIFGAIIFSESTESKQTDLGYFKTEEGCICYLIYAPICATNGQTYGNDCMLRCAQRQNPYVMGVCHGECPCCKEPYQNDPSFPIDIPVPSIPSPDQGGSDGGWGWSHLGGWQWKQGTSKYTFPFVHGRYSPYASYAASALNGKGSYVQISMEKSKKSDIDDGDKILALVSSPELLAEPLPVVSVVSKPTSALKEDADHQKTIEVEPKHHEMNEIKPVNSASKPAMEISGKDD